MHGNSFHPFFERGMRAIVAQARRRRMFCTQQRCFELNTKDATDKWSADPHEASDLQNGHRCETTLSHLYAALKHAIKHCSDFITSR
jgi:hypothetical protein